MRNILEFIVCLLIYRLSNEPKTNYPNHAQSSYMFFWYVLSKIYNKQMNESTPYSHVCIYKYIYILLVQSSNVHIRMPILHIFSRYSYIWEYYSHNNNQSFIKLFSIYFCLPINIMIHRRDITLYDFSYLTYERKKIIEKRHCSKWVMYLSATWNNFSRNYLNEIGHAKNNYCKKKKLYNLTKYLEKEIIRKNKVRKF